ncbi:MAG TPA: RCC1 domain-containing protein, partial [bacterium]|nr:RCC1 domain-containing protein [bacterium]
ATFAIDGDNMLYFWGNSYENYVSDIREEKNYTEPVIVDDGSWRQISTGDNHTCGIRSDNHLYCWGYNGDGQLGFETFY